MTHELNVSRPLTADELEQVKAFAEFLISRRPTQEASDAPANKISFDGWAGCRAGIAPDKSDKQLVREAWDDLLKKYD